MNFRQDFLHSEFEKMQNYSNQLDHIVKQLFIEGNSAGKLKIYYKGKGNAKRNQQKTNYNNYDKKYQGDFNRNSIFLPLEC